MTKRILALLCTAILLVASVPVALMAPGDVVWTLDEAEIDAYISSKNAGDYLMNSGTFSASKVGKTIKFSNRDSDYACVDFKVESLDKDGEYTLTVKFSAPTPTVFRLAKGYSDWSAFVDSTEAKTSDTLQYTFTKDATTKNIRIRTANTEEFTIESIVVTEGKASDIKKTTASPSTGVESFVFIALGVLALTAVGAVVFTRKAKSM